MKEGTLEVTILVRPGCHLCETVEKELLSLGKVVPRLVIVNIDTNRELYEKYLLRIPIVTVRGKVVFEGSMMDPGGTWKGELPLLLG
jgi:predicted thioredoxin/glutaredoxin